jgi:hypothetical protein
VSTSLIHIRTIDVSEGGAKLDVQSRNNDGASPKDFERGTLVLLSLGGLVSPQLYQVRWQKGAIVGVQFQNCLSVDLLEAFATLYALPESLDLRTSGDAVS